ncbi:MAG: hypothetical protein A2Y62_06930 [Candidatus Fischerbacteria bacterium RBG_13_37_8]|uniref:Uncharacterized protein n=1 Tax=Candidatus Fischerbacteria bacterium RBG_13_37_8 TaxID=1817863 RepID=A0A1F5VMP8_9BACT|nr:MAG: hypothetical protein A2Y62_06930 [Candidatus Fischerbacteria bacterium RBG_13_37_8]
MIMNSEKLSIVVIFIAFLVVIGFSGIYAQGDRSVEVIDAIKRGSVADLKKLAAEGVEMNVADEQGVTYLILAVRMGNKEIVKVLVDAGADVNAKDMLGYTALGWAVDNNVLDIVKILIGAGASAQGKGGNSQQSAILSAACNGRVSLFRDLLNTGVDLSKAGDARGFTPIVCAARNGNLEIVNMIIEKKAEIDIRNMDGRAALAESSKPEITRALLKAGANIELKDYTGATPLLYAAWKRSDEVLKELIDAGAEVNVKDNRGRTPVMGAVIDGKLDNLQLLIKHGAKVNEVDNDGWTALLIAAKEGMKYNRDKMAEELLKAGADISVSNEKGRTPLIYAAAANSVPMVELFIKAGSDINAKDADGYTALGYAKKADFVNVIKVLEEHGAKE